MLPALLQVIAQLKAAGCKEVSVQMSSRSLTLASRGTDLPTECELRVWCCFPPPMTVYLPSSHTAVCCAIKHSVN